jgi:two-component system OmpR family response regulator
VAHDGDDGLWRARESSYDAIVLDVLLPGQSGYQVCSRLREEGNWTPILMLTAKNGEYDEAEALDTGADDFLSKPFSYPVLVARLRALIRRGGHARPVELAVGALRLAPASRRAWRDDREILLTAREFSVLELLLRRGDEVVTKTEILESVWDSEFEGDPNTVEVYIRRLRRKIDGSGRPSAIQTIRGAGYRVDGS